MKLKNILAAITAIATMVSGTSVFAADKPESFSVGLPIDVSTGAEATEITAGQFLAFPVDITSTSGNVISFQINLQYDNSVLTPGIVDADLPDAEYSYLSELGGIVNDNANTGLDDLVATMGTRGRNGFTPYGTYTLNAGFAANEVAYGWYDIYSRALNADGPELYLLFTAKGSVSSDKLNYELATINPLKSTVGNTDTGNVNDVTGPVEKLNQCFGAFTVSVDDAALEAEKIWVTAVNADIYTDSGKGTKIGTYQLVEYVNEAGSTIYAFPTRITTNNANVDSAYVEIVATTNTKEDGSGTAGTKNLAGKTISLTSTVTDYE